MLEKLYLEVVYKNSVCSSGSDIDIAPCSEDSSERRHRNTFHMLGVYKVTRHVILVGRYECMLHNIPDLLASRSIMLTRRDDTGCENALLPNKLLYISLRHVQLHSIEEG